MSIEATIIVRGIATSFYKFITNRIKNSQIVRDFKEKYIRDNYHESVTSMFKAVIHDAKRAVELPDEVIGDLLDDETNRTEIFRWIIEGVFFDRFSKDRLCLDPYFELHEKYQDKIVPFFQVILLKIHEFKISNSQLEFLQITSKLDLLQKNIDDLGEDIEDTRNYISKKLDDIPVIISNLLQSPGYEDLKNLLDEREHIEARTRAHERLNRPNISREEKLELYSVIANSYLNTTNQEDAIPYLKLALDVCMDRARKYRYLSLISLLENNAEQSLINILEALKIEGETKANIHILVNVYVYCGEFEKALEAIQSNNTLELEKLKGYVLLVSQKYDELIRIANEYLDRDENQCDWLMYKLEGMVMQMEESILQKIPVPLSNVLESAFLILQHLSDMALDAIQRFRLTEIEAGLNFRAKQFGKSKVLFKELMKSCRASDSERYFQNYIAACLCDGDWDSVISFLQEKIARNKYDKEDILNLCTAYIEKGIAEEALKLLEEKNFLFRTSNYHISIDYYLAYMNTAYYCISVSKIDQLIEEMLQNDSPIDHVDAVKGYHAFLLKDWDEAIDRLETSLISITGDVQKELVSKLIHAYFERGRSSDYSKLVDLIPSLPYWQYSETMFNRYVISLYNAGLYDKLIKLHKSEYYEKTVTLLETVALIYFNYGWYTLATEYYLTLFRKTKKIEFLLQYSRCLHRTGNNEACLKAIQQAEKQIQNSGAVQEFYLLSKAYRDVHDFKNAMKYAYQVYRHGKDNPEIQRFYFSFCSSINRFLDDEESEWVEAYHHIMTNFHNQFQDEEPLFEQVKALEDDNTISNDLIQRMKQYTTDSKNIKNLVNNTRLPIGWLAQRLSKGIYETWGSVTHDKEMNVWVCAGNLHEINNGLRSVEKSSKVVCDIVSLFTLNELGLINHLRGNYETIYIYQEHIDLLLSELRKLSLIKEEGSTTIGYDEISGKLIWWEIEANVIQRTYDDLANFTEWVKANCEIIGKNIIDFSVDKKYIDLFGEYYIEPIKSCKEQQAVFLVDSTLIRDAAREIFGVECITTFDLLNFLLRKSVIQQTVYDKCFVTLIRMGYSLLPLNANIFWRLLVQNLFQIQNQDIEEIFGYLSRIDFNQDYKLRLVSEVLMKLWLDSQAAPYREIITQSLCSIVTRQQRKEATIKKLLEISRQQFSFLVDHVWQELHNCVLTWLNAQNLI